MKINNKDKNIVLIGFMGSGKTSVGKRLFLVLKREFIDTDDFIEKREGMTKMFPSLFTINFYTIFYFLQTKHLPPQTRSNLWFLFRYNAPQPRILGYSPALYSIQDA